MKTKTLVGYVFGCGCCTDLCKNVEGGHPEHIRIYVKREEAEKLFKEMNLKEQNMGDGIIIKTVQIVYLVDQDSKGCN